GLGARLRAAPWPPGARGYAGAGRVGLPPRCQGFRPGCRNSLPRDRREEFGYLEPVETLRGPLLLRRAEPAPRRPAALRGGARSAHRFTPRTRAARALGRPEC